MATIARGISLLDNVRAIAPILRAHAAEDQEIGIQLASSHAIRSAAEAVDLVHQAAGTSAIREEQPFERYFRDAHVMPQRAFGSAPRFESAGKLMFGLDTDWPFFAL